MFEALSLRDGFWSLQPLRVRGLLFSGSGGIRYAVFFAVVHEIRASSSGNGFWSTNSVRGTLFQRPGLQSALLEYKPSARNALLGAGP